MTKFDIPVLQRNIKVPAPPPKKKCFIAEVKKSLQPAKLQTPSPQMYLIARP